MRAGELGDPDLEEARRLLREDRVALAVVKDGQVLAARHGAGLAPLYWTVKELGERLQGARVPQPCCSFMPGSPRPSASS